MKGAIFIWLLSSIAMAMASVNYIKSVYVLNSRDSTTFEKMVLDNEKKRLFVAAENLLIEMDEEKFQDITSVSTGPRMDALLCPTHILNHPCDYPLVKTNSYCKALLIDRHNGVLIMCTSLYQGICIKYNLTDLTELDESLQSRQSIVANNATASTVAFIAPSPLLDDKNHQMDALYVGVQYTGQGWQRNRIPAFASLRLNNFKLVHDSMTLYKTEINAESNVKARFPIYYKYGFSSEGFNYMLTVQKESPDASRELYISKIFRVCQMDQWFVSYVELHLQCWHQGTLYNLTQSAHLGKAGVNLAKALGISALEDVLYVTFSKGPPRSAEPNRGSAVCIYPMRYIRSKFTENVKKCFEGIGNTGPPHFFKPNKCSNLSVSIGVCLN